MTGIYIVPNENIVSRESGIGSKIRKQIELFNINGLNCTMLVQRNLRYGLPKLIGRLLYVLPFSNIAPNWKYESCMDHADFLYFRRPELVNYAAVRFMKICKTKNPNIKIFVEIPTYPYDSEFKGIQKLNLIRDKMNRRHFYKYVDCVFVIDPMNMIRSTYYNAEVVHFINGYDVMHCSKINFFNNDDTVDLTCVGMFNFWHGYERLFYGLKNYLDNGGHRDVKIHMVGEGVELDRYKHLVSQLHIENYVTFYGKLFGNDLDKIYSITDIAVGCLGCYKKDITIISDLKTREYMAKGLPVLSGCSVDFLYKKKYDYFLEIENNSNPVDFSLIERFYNFLRTTPAEYHDQIVSFSHNAFDVSNTMIPIVEKIKGEINA